MTARDLTTRWQSTKSVSLFTQSIEFLLLYKPVVDNQASVCISVPSDFNYLSLNYHSNRIVANRWTEKYFAGSQARQNGSGLGSAIRKGLKGFVIPLSKKYGIPLAKLFLSTAAPEYLEILDGCSLPKSSIKKFARIQFVNK